jgi:hypothetical protein
MRWMDYEFNGTKDITWYIDRYSGRDDWESGVAFSKDPDEFRDVNFGALPATKTLGRSTDEEPLELVQR